MTFRERIQWIFRMGLLLFILASVAFLSALTAMRFAIQGREVAMPDVAGKTVIEARQILQGRGVQMKIEDRIFSPLAVDEVVRQSPPPGMQVKIGQDAHVVLSLGPQKVTIPQIEDTTLRAARIELLRDAMQVGEVSSAYLPGWPQDQVIQQDPASGSSDATSPHVNILVSLGPRSPAYVMPDFAGLTLSQAESKLGSAGLKVGKITPTQVLGAVSGTVVAETPQPGQRVDAGTTIDLQVTE